MNTTSPNVLLVDDDKFLLDMYSVKFSQAGFHVQSCFSSAEALKVLQSDFKPDIILFDVTMPGEDGFALIQKIRDGNLAPQARLIALTNQGNDADKKHAEDLGVHKYCIKATMIPSEVVSMVKTELGI